ncbi:unnamed protein product, partial [Prorocentrum cordatum]
MAPLMVRLNLPGFSSEQPFQLASSPDSLAGLVCAVLQEIAGLSGDELQDFHDNVDSVPLSLLAEMQGGNLIPLTSDAELKVFLESAGSSGRGPGVVEVRSREDPPPAGRLQAAPESPRAAPPSDLDGGASADAAGGYAAPSPRPEADEAVDATAPWAPLELAADPSPAPSPTPSPAAARPSSASRLQPPRVYGGGLRSDEGALGGRRGSGGAEDQRARAPAPAVEPPEPPAAPAGGAAAAPLGGPCPTEWAAGPAGRPQPLRGGGASRALQAVPAEEDAEGFAGGARGLSAGARAREPEAPAHMRLYKETEDRRRRAQEARVQLQRDVDEDQE